MWSRDHDVPAVPWDVRKAEQPKERGIGGIWAVFCPVGAVSPQTQVLDAAQSSPGFSWQQSGRRVRAETPLPTGLGCFQNASLKEETSHPGHPRAHSSVLPSSQVGGETGKKEEGWNFLEKS